MAESMIKRKDKHIRTGERRELGPCDSAYMLPELMEAKREVEKKKNALYDFLEQVMTQGIKIRLEEANTPQWTSIKEELPKDSGTYFVWCGEGYDLALYIKNVKWCLPDMRDITKLVTHWMPLPEPPKEVD